VAETKSDNKEKAIQLAMEQIERAFGVGSIMKLGAGAALKNISVISTTSLALDRALGVGGIPRGRVTEIFGPESGGKTTLALHIAAEAQKGGGVVGFIDAEHALDPIYARKLGVNIDEFLVSQPDTGEQALEIAEMLVRSAAIDLVIIDSVAALVPKSEINGEMGDPQMGSQARLMSQALRKLTGVVSKSKASLVFINQVRQKIGGVMFGNPEVTTGGRALKFYASIRLDIRRLTSIKNGQDIIGNRVRVKVAKNKLAPPFKEAEFDIMYGYGISREADLLDIATEYDMVEKSGTWFSFNGQRLGQGRENAKIYLKQNPQVFAEIQKKVLEKIAADKEADNNA
jgi:recombination protein RecA